MAIEDLLSYVANNPQYWPVAIDAVAGYVLFASLYRKSKYWRQFDTAERWVLGGLLGIFVGSLIIWPVIDAFFYMIWRSETNSGFAAALVLGGLALYFLLLRLSGENEYSILSFLRKFIISFCGIAVTIACVSGTISFQTHGYPPTVAPIIAQYWSAFQSIDFLLVFSTLFALGFYNLLEIRRIELRSRSAADAKRDLMKWRNRPLTKLVSRKTALAILAVLFISIMVPLSLVSADLNYALFTPKLTQAGPTPYPSETCNTTDESHSGWIVVVGYSSDNFVIYQVSMEQFHLQLPRIHSFVDTVHIPNPSNASYILVPSSALSGQYEWQWAWTNGTRGLMVNPEPNAANFNATEVNFSAVHNLTAEFNFFYWQQYLLKYRDITIQKFKNTTALGKGWFSEKYSFVINSKEKNCIVVPRIMLEDLNDQGANSTSAVVWINGSMALDQTVDHGTFYPWAFAESGKDLNVTVTFRTTVA
jgi:hypothetical protein